MSITFPGYDTRHIIQKAMNSKSLQTLAKEEDAYQAQLAYQRDNIQRQPEPKQKSLPLILTKDDINSLRIALAGKSADEIFAKLGIDVEYDKNGKKTISHYKWPFQCFNFKAAGINEAELLKDVVRIKGNCNLTGSYAKNLGAVRFIGGDLRIPLFGELEDLSGVKYIGHHVICDAEHTEDSIKRIKQLKLNPDYMGGYLNPMDLSFYELLRTMPSNMEEAIKYLQRSQHPGRA